MSEEKKGILCSVDIVENIDRPKWCATLRGKRAERGGIPLVAEKASLLSPHEASLPSLKAIDVQPGRSIVALEVWNDSSKPLLTLTLLEWDLGQGSLSVSPNSDRTSKYIFLVQYVVCCVLCVVLRPPAFRQQSDHDLCYYVMFLCYVSCSML